jgi:hypothetical protein
MKPQLNFVKPAVEATRALLTSWTNSFRAISVN